MLNLPHKCLIPNLIWLSPVLTLNIARFMIRDVQKFHGYFWPMKFPSSWRYRIPPIGETLGPSKYKRTKIKSVTLCGAFTSNKESEPLHCLCSLFADKTLRKSCLYLYSWLSKPITSVWFSIFTCRGNSSTFKGVWTFNVLYNSSHF